MTLTDLETEVTIIGGGAVGCLTAYSLAREGVDVILVEKDDLASGAIGASNGWVTVEPEPELRKITKIGREMYHNLDQHLKKEIEYRVETKLDCYTDEDVIRMRKLHVWPNLVEKLKRRENLKEPEPNLADDITWVRESKLPYINPNKLCYSFANHAKKFGARIFTHTRALAINTSEKKVRTVITEKGKIQTRYVVNAAGAWSKEIGHMVNIQVPIVPIFGQIVVTEPTPPLVRNYYNIGGAGWSRTLYPEKVKDWETMVKFGVFDSTITEYWPSENAYLIAGCNTSRKGCTLHVPLTDKRPPIFPEVLKLAVEHAIRFIPKLSRLHIIRAFSGLRPMCEIDRLPIIGPVEEVEGFILATGTFHYGVSTAIIFGKLISELVTENTTSIPIDELSYSRFKNLTH